MATLAVGGGRRATAQEQPSAAQLDVDFSHDPSSQVVGNPAGSVTVVEFFDYRCPYCRATQPTLQSSFERDKTVKLVLKDWPIFGGVSIGAAKARHRRGLAR